MSEISPKIAIEGVEVDYLEGSYSLKGGLTAAVVTFKMTIEYAGQKKLWNKEVTLYLNEYDSTPLFRGWIKRTNPTLSDIEIRAEDAFGYMLKGGEQSVAKVLLTDRDNVDGLSASAAMADLITRAKLDGKLKTDYIGNTTPVVGTLNPPLRGNVVLMDALKQMLSQALDTTGTLPRPNMAKIVDDGTNSQLVIELENEIEGNPIIQHVFTERDNITDLNIINFNAVILK